MASNSAGAIRLFVLGDARIETPRGDIEPNAELAFATGLYLLLERSDAISRRGLEGLLWPNVKPEAASHRLRQTLLKLRRSGLPVESVGKSRLRATAPSLRIDFEEFIAASDRTSLPATGVKVLPGYQPRFSPMFSDWLDNKRETIHGHLSRIILESIARHRLMGEWVSVESRSRILLEFAPFNEEATLALAEALAMRGAKIDAVRLLDQYIAEVGSGPAELRVPAAVIRRRIADRITDRPDPPIPATPLIGRSGAMRELGSMLQSLRLGTGSSCLVWGDAGIGKSRLLSELANFASLQGVATARAHCRLGDSHRPLSVFVDLVPALRGMRGALGCSPDTMKYLDRLTHHRDDDPTPIGLQGDADFVYAKLQRALFDLFDAVSEERPLLIIIEDIHRLDDVSIALLSDIIPWSLKHPIFFAFSGRGNDYPWIAALAEGIKSLSLLPLTVEASRELASATMAQYGREVADDYLNWCVRVAEGNPYFLVELTSHWVETGGQYVAPPSLQAVISRRIARLDSFTLQLLQTCSLLDKNSTIDRIEKVLGFEHYRLLQCINDLGTLGMLVVEHADVGNDRSGRLAPRHELLANAAEQALTEAGRVYLHRRIGTVLEDEITDNPSAAILWDCAKHWQQAGNTAQAFVVARSCATHLMKLGLCGVAAEAYEKSLSYCDSDTQRLDILEGQANAYFRASDWQKLSATAAKVRHLQRYLRPQMDGHDEVELMDLRSMWQRGDLDATRTKALECLTCLTASSDHRLRAGIMALMLLDLACDHDAMRSTYELVKPLIDDTNSDPAYRFEASMVFESVCGDFVTAVSAAESLINARRHSDSIADFIRALTNGSVAARTAGRIDLARQWLHEALAVATAHKLPLASEVPMQTLASIALDTNEIQEATEWYNKLLMLPESPSYNRTIRDSIGLRLALSNGDVGSARSLVHSDLHQLAADVNPHRRTYGVALLVAVDLAHDLDPDTSLIARLETAHLVSRRNARQAFATFVLVAALRRAGQHAKSNRLLNEYLARYRREPSPPPLHVLQLMESFRGRSAS